ncbi:MAG TPA: hypothetical protein VNA25_10475 [Phycisphaerae bacterium]|nr:hypothetical protein [Phycisphaerae bacterium]
MTHQNTETLKQWFAEQVEFAKSTVEYWQELATIARGEVVALQARVKELESQLYSTRVTDVMNLRARIAELEARDKVKAEEYDTRIMLANHLEIERDELTKRIADLERERDHANMVADAAAEKIKDLEALAKARAVGRKD